MWASLASRRILLLSSAFKAVVSLGLSPAIKSLSTIEYGPGQRFFQEFFQIRSAGRFRLVGGRRMA